MPHKKSKRKIAILGTAPTTIASAPFKEKDWEIWACSPGLGEDVLPRWDRWFELHSPAEVKEVAPEFYKWLSGELHGPVYTLFDAPDWPTAKSYPKEMIEKRFSTWFLTSTIAWMMALAITEKPQAIGLWGVDMMDQSEYGWQKAGCLHFIRIAILFGIDVTLPPASELLVEVPPYPDSHCNPATLVIDRRVKFQNKNLEKVSRHLDEVQKKQLRLQGAMEELMAIRRLMLQDEEKSE